MDCLKLNYTNEVIFIKSYNLTLKRLFPILVIITLLVCIGAVSAANNNQTINTSDDTIADSVQANTSNTGNVITKTVQNDTSKDTTTNIKSDTKILTTTTSNNQNTTTVKPQKSLSVVYVSTLGNDNNSGVCSSPKASISNALSTVANGGSIYIDAGKYYEKNIYINKSVKIIGNATKSTIINGEENHVFTIANDVTVTFSKLRITNASSSKGGAIYNRGTLTLNYVRIDTSSASECGGAIYNIGKLNGIKSTFCQNYAQYGGAIYNDGIISMSRCSYSENNARVLGSAIVSSKEIKVYDTNFTYNGNSAIYIKKSSNTNVIDCSNFLVNSGTNGGAIFNIGKLLLNKTYFKENEVIQYGGAIYNKGTITSYNSTYTSNLAKSGGAIYNTKTLYIDNNSFKTNIAEINGGAITNIASLTIKNTKYTSNKASKYGGAIDNTLASTETITIDNTTFTLNNVKVNGGAIYTYGYAKLNITNSAFTSNNINALYIKTINTANSIYNSIFTKNTAINGAAIYDDGSSLNINKSTFKSNTATQNGGAIYNYKGKITLINSILTNNKKIDVYNSKGKIIANYNWWSSNKVSNLRQYNSTVNNWIYLRVTSSSSSCDINDTIKTTVNINNIYNGKTIKTYKTSTYLPTITVNGSIIGCNVNKTFKFTNGQINISNKYTKTGIVTIKAYTYNQLVTNTITVKDEYVTSLYVQMYDQVTSANVTQWVKAGITDVYVQSRASTNNTIQLRNVINLCSGTSIKVHAWVICFSTDSGFDLSVKQQTMIKNFINNVIRINGVKGISLDYIRYSGNDKSIVNSSIITNFVKSVNSIVKGYNNELILSASLFPEKQNTVIYYGQNYSALSPYLDYELIMTYKYDFYQNRTWIQDVISYVSTQSKHAKVVAVLQTYNTKYTPLNATELTLDAKAAISGGSYGYTLFKYGLIKTYPTSTKNLIS